MASSKAASVGRYYKSAQPCFLASCIRHIIEQGLAFHRIIIIGTRPFLEPASRARFSRSGHPPRAAPHPDPPARPPRLSLRAPPHRTAPPSVIPLNRLISLRYGRRLPLHPARTRHFFARYHDPAPPPSTASAARHVSRVLPRVRHGVDERQPHPARLRPCPPARLASLSPFCPTALPRLA